MRHAGTRGVEVSQRPVVCAVDDQEWSHGAVDVAKRLAAQVDARLVLVHARQWTGAAGTPRA